jgi:hypothetical protein
LYCGRNIPILGRNLLHPSYYPSSTLKMGAAGSSEMLIYIYQPTGCEVPKDINYYTQCKENMKSHTD